MAATTSYRGGLVATGLDDLVMVMVVMVTRTASRNAEGSSERRDRDNHQPA
jgi:hypothetical protein